jgi:tetratricopeptide (TPR) repeat protein
LIPVALVLGCGGGERTSESRYADLLSRADLRWSQGEEVGARDILDEILDKDETVFAARYRLGAMAVDTTPTEAETHLELAAALDPGHPGPPFFTACARYHVNDYAGGDEAMKMAYDLARARRGYSFPETTETVREGLVALEQNQLVAALRAFTQALEDDPSQPGLWYLYGKTSLTLGGLPQAQLGADRALELDPDFAEALALRSRVRLESGDRDGAREAADRAVALRPELSPVRYQLGLLHLQDNEYRQSALEFWRAVLADPTDPEPHEALGQALTRVQMLELGARQAQHAEWLRTFLGRHLGRPGFTPPR